MWEVINTNAVDRLEMTDHGPIHFQIVANTALKIYRLIRAKGILSAVERDFGLTSDHAEVVIFLASVLHDIGMTVNREDHESFSIVLSTPILEEILSFLPCREKTILVAEIQHAIISHRTEGKPVTLEAGIVRVADALDMSKGRSRFPYDSEKLDIHSVSALAIDEIELRAGRKAPVEVRISMNHTAGLFQIDKLIRKKMKGAGMETYLEIKVYMDKGGDQQLFKDYYSKD